MITLCCKLLYKGKFIPVGRRIFREKLISGRKQKSPIILLPPYISIHELRLMLNINYETCFKAANVYKSGNQYKWKDSEDRTFQSVNKRNVIIPYSTAAYVSKIFKFKPRLIEVELFCEEEEKKSGTLQDVYRKVYLAEEYHANVLRLQGESTNDASHGNHANVAPKDTSPSVQANPNEPRSQSSCYDPPCLPPKEQRSPLDEKKKNYYTVVSVIGHINHGKTTMLDKMTNNNLALSEAGCITQNIKPIHFERGPFKFTFVDTPGHKVFQIFRGRAAFLSDILIILISLEVGAEIQTEEAIKYADKFGIPVVFVLNKADLYGENESIVKAELRKQCTNMYDQGNLKHNFSKEIENAIAISSLTGYNLDKLMNRLFFISHYIDLPYHSVNRFYNNCEAIRDADLGVGNSLGGGSARDNPLHGKTLSDNNPDGRTPHEYTLHEEKTHPSMYNTEKAKERRKSDLNLLQKYIRKSDCLLAIDKNPVGMGMVVDISKDSSKGTILHVIIRNGFFIEGSYFICGSAYGKIQKMYKFNSNFKESCSYASIGMAVLISGMKKHGNATTDDLIFTLPQSNAFRLCQYRLMVEKLATLQVSGKEIKVSWENDMKKNEFHSEDIYQNRLAMSDKRKAIEEFGIEKENIFEDVSVEEFHKSNTQRKKEEEEEQKSVVIELEEENKYEDLSRVKKKKIQSILSQGDSDESILVPEENTFSFFESPKQGEHLDPLVSSHWGGVHYQEKDQPNSSSGAQKINPLTHDQQETENDITNERNNNFQSRPYNTESATLYERTEVGKEEDAHEEKGKTHSVWRTSSHGRGRKSRHALNSDAKNGQPSQEASDSNSEQYTDEKKLNDPWYYEESEETWAKKVLQRNDELMETWRNKTRQREIEKERQIFYEKQMILKNEILRRKLLGEEKLTEEEINAYLYEEEKSNANNSQESSSDEPIELPQKNCPVIPIIIRTNYVGMFDIFLDEFENLQKIYNVKISVVHGGIGPITPNDVVHAEVESNFGYCCIYAFQVKVLPDSVKQSVLSNIVIKQFDVFTDLIDDVVNRIKNVKALIAHNMYVRSLKSERTQEGV
ncbi:translation initiation factor IF-2, putative [Plasmodium knowlesi strain H]|uniref:Translation initiation factor IF-2, putative n=3 Tax=Plasmodium knowlesi TaxID=5850 RepID=A0A5K1UDA8_PLAKH|nr:translation initiation factor IF-2, putative [Plasmodium knowlesi strain H]OTN63934.1 putative Translation initiation factor IF-2 [Plasmodium knowlesi]CAA9990730.1 translation initiation factor IF-2, putative [Plasmodium knowlesi strain H]SBO21199.1 translation initiation factor IF-2, putative [Plasmodium knowlesi strain H]SBO21651.1 translation initiation factor IF-2, putative [Plasmodium knowlesi strain H]VVS80204.1 translation initiation factor IF-2, putative [Plasmodium knowlesi strain |eukprot:XP_002262020.1 translation initiation factor if-2, putative [Plasmodium knowlesi strain H]